MNRLYPLFVKLDGRFCLVVGGGEVAAWKIRALRAAGATVTVVSPEVVAEVEDLARAGLLRWLPREYEPADLDGRFLVIVATDDPEVSRRVFRDCENQGILCNAVDQDEFCSFHVPAVSQRGDIKVAISTAGKSPAFAAHLKERIARVLTEDDAELVRRLGRVREHVKSTFAGDPERRKRYYQGVVERFARRTSGGHATTHLGGAPAQAGRVYLVGAGPGDGGLLTVRGERLLATADVVYYDRLVGRSIIERMPASVERVYVGRRSGSGADTPTARLLIDAARAGRATVRLKGGDPNLFGRGGEEMLALLEAGTPFEVVPGVSALTAVPSAANIPITFRGVAQQVVIRSGYRLPDPASPALVPTRAAETTFVYFMTVGRLSEIVRELREHDGLAGTTPVAVIQRGTREDQSVLTGTLETILDLAARTPLHPPALVVAGEVVRFADRESVRGFLRSLPSEADGSTAGLAGARAAGRGSASDGVRATRGTFPHEEKPCPGG